jgi:CheY-like chemotaxis protein
MSTERDANPDRLTVLVVEDEWLLREVIGTYLRDAGCRVIEAESGETALAMLHDGAAVDVVFTDIRLTGDVNGWDVGEAARVTHGNIPVIYASGYSISPPRQVTGSLFFSKPYDPEAVLKACRALGGGH